MKEMESRRLADLEDDIDFHAEEQRQTMASSPGSTHHNIQVLEPTIPFDTGHHDRRRSMAAERAVSRSFIVRDCRRYSLVSRRGTVSISLLFTFVSRSYCYRLLASCCLSVCLSGCDAVHCGAYRVGGLCGQRLRSVTRAH